MKTRQKVRFSEKDLERAAVRLAVAAGGECFKFLPFMVNGLPDRVALLPGGRTAFLEVKSSGQRPTPLQAFRLDRLAALGFPVFIIHDDITLNSFKEWTLQKIKE